MSNVWTQLDPLAMVGGPSGDASDDVTTGGLGQAGLAKAVSIAHPDHPFFWFAALAGVTVGLVGVSTHLRVGPARAGVDLGKA